MPNFTEKHKKIVSPTEQQSWNKVVTASVEQKREFCCRQSMKD